MVPRVALPVAVVVLVCSLVLPESEMDALFVTVVETMTDRLFSDALWDLVTDFSRLSVRVRDPVVLCVCDAVALGRVSETSADAVKDVEGVMLRESLTEMEVLGDKDTVADLVSSRDSEIDRLLLRACCDMDVLQDSDLLPANVTLCVTEVERV